MAGAWGVSPRPSLATRIAPGTSPRAAAPAGSGAFWDRIIAAFRESTP